MLLRDILQEIQAFDIKNSNIKNKDLEKKNIYNIAIDSRECTNNCIFLAYNNNNLDKNQFIKNAIENGSNVIISDLNFIELTQNFKQYFRQTYFISIPNLIDEIYNIIQKFFGFTQPQNTIAITGTNGKTSSAHYTKQILKLLNIDSVVIGTLGVSHSNPKYNISQEHNFTTSPDIISFHKILTQTKKNNINNVIFETTSHALDQKRIVGINLKIAAITNITADHLDYHKNIENYKQAKFLLFKTYLPKQQIAIINADDKSYPELLEICRNKQHKIIDYGYNAQYGLKLLQINNYLSHSIFNISYNNNIYDAKINLPGEFNVYNILCAIAIIVALKKEFALSHIIKTLPKIIPINGRLELIYQNQKKNNLVFIDFAHTEDALANILEQIKKYNAKHILLVFGCGGNRDKTKRKKMAKIADKYCNIVIVTDDNPRFEDPEQIRNEIITYIEQAEKYSIASRELAIKKAISLMKNNDILIIAGKGAETYQIIGDKKYQFYDKEIALKYLDNCGK